MGKLLIQNIGLLATNVEGAEVVPTTSLLIEDGTVAAIGDDSGSYDEVIDAGGLSVIPGLIDGHVHPTFGEWTPAQNATGWIGNYLHGGTTSMVSAGELHIPGLSFEDLSPDLVCSIAILSKHTTGRMRPSGVKVYAGTVILVPGMTERDFDLLAKHNITQAKFIFYDWSLIETGEYQNYLDWAHDRGMTVKMHSGGVSRSGSSRVAGLELVARVNPDVIAHLSGGPIPMPDDEIREVIATTTGAVEVCSSMNYRATKVVVDALVEADQLNRLVLGTDTPGGTGVIPRGMLRNIEFLCMCGLDPLDALRAATISTARAHSLDAGTLAVGSPADLLILGPIKGSLASNVLECFTMGDLPGIAGVLIDGETVVRHRSEQTPPPQMAALWC
jgi:enamidase